MVSGVTIPEGTTARQAYELLAKGTGVPVKDFQTRGRTRRRSASPASGSTGVTTRSPPARSRASSSRTRTSSRPSPPRRRSSASWCRSSSASPVRWASSKGAEHPRGLAVRSADRRVVVQAEGGVAEDWPKMARVAYNRAYKDPKMPLQFDVTRTTSSTCRPRAVSTPAR